MLKVTTASEINTILSEDDAAVYKEGVEYSVVVPSKLAAQMRRKLIILGLREPVNFIWEEVKVDHRATGDMHLFMFANMKETMQFIAQAYAALQTTEREFMQETLRSKLAESNAK